MKRATGKNEPFHHHTSSRDFFYWKITRRIHIHILHTHLQILKIILKIKKLVISSRLGWTRMHHAIMTHHLLSSCFCSHAKREEKREEKRREEKRGKEKKKEKKRRRKRRKKKEWNN